MWLAAIVLGAVVLLAGFLVKNSRLRMILKIVGIVLIVLGLVYGALVMILLGDYFRASGGR